MTLSTADQMRQWRGPAILSFGFRPMFLLASLWAVLAMVAWMAMLSGALSLPTRLDAVSWHAHEFLFGYLAAVIAGFLLTAVPNWTGRLPVVGWKIAGLAVLWLLGRLAILASIYLPVWAVTIADIAFLIVLCGVILREIVAGRNWRNLPVLALVGLLILANLLFHIEAADGGFAAQSVGLRFGLSVALVLMTLIGGRIIPSFTRNWLVGQGHSARPAPPMQRFDKATILVSVLALVAWTGAPTHMFTGGALVLMAVLNGMRLLRWQGIQTRREPLVWVLHVAYGFIPLGALMTGVAILSPHVITQVAALHVWTVGAIGLLTMAVMTRATLGHTGRPLHAGLATTVIYLALIFAVFARVAADWMPPLRMVLVDSAGFFWIAGFAGFVLIYGRLLLRPKKGVQD